jgi:threonine/homoserine/homoserine lactone efflux protein
LQKWYRAECYVNLAFFLLQVVVISLSGVMAPGPVTASAIAMGTQNRYAGALIALGHGIVEFPLIILITLGMGKMLQSTWIKIVIGAAGGALLIFMAIQMIIGLKTAATKLEPSAKDAPVLTGLVLSVTNPYFLLWWATVGLAIATRARMLGIWAFALFALVHWLCDLIWTLTLSWASFKGSAIFGLRGQRVVLMICALALLVFGLFFLYSAAASLI